MNQTFLPLRRGAHVARALLLLTLLLIFAACGPKMRAAPEFEATLSQSAIERGRYLSQHVALCSDCHSPRNFEEPGFPAIAGQEYSGGFYGEREDLLVDGKKLPISHLQASNISQHHEHGIGRWTDGEIARAIREGVNKQGKALFPMMPYPDYRYMSDADMLAIIAYLRSIEPREGEAAGVKVKFPLSLIMRTIPKPLDGPVTASFSDEVERGAYLTRMAGCTHCHSPMVRGTPIKGKEFSGGAVHQFEGRLAGMGMSVGTNITPDPETGIGNVTDEQWLTMFREGVGIDGRPMNGFMPWVFYRGMTDEDLLAILAYLRTYPPIHNDARGNMMAQYSD